MRENLQNATYVIPDMAISGQITVFIAKPNSGKTLFFMYSIIEGITRGILKPEDIFYINADDHYQGFYEKTEIASRHGFSMISPSEANINKDEIISLLVEMADSGQADGKVIFLDTIKKFVDMMAKRQLAEFLDTLRKLTNRGATIIIAGHANKHLDADGKLVYEGTADQLNDVDCLYYIYRRTDKTDREQLIEFINDKDRGSVVQQRAYSYIKSHGMYEDMLKSFGRADDDAPYHLAQQKHIEEIKCAYELEFQYLTNLLSRGEMKLNDILARHKQDKPENTSGKSIQKVLNELDGIEWISTKKKEENNARYFRLKPKF